ncbi:MAG: murein biosynthesis integral membrane protein MurJ, partial [Propionicimonas sp.]
MTESPASGGRRLINATAVMASGTMVSRILGLVRAMMIAFILGNGTMRVDVFSLAMTVPNSLYLLLAGGTLNNVLVPQIVRSVNHDADGGKAFVDRIMTGFLVILGALSVVFTVAAPAVMSIYTKPIWRSPEMADHWHSLVLMTYITMPQIFFYGVFFLIGQVLNARERFGPMMWAPILNNVVAIGTLGLYLWVWGTQASSSAAFTDQQVWLLGVGATVGIAVQTLVLLPFLKRAGFSYRPRFDLKGTGLGRTFHIAKWMVGYVALTSLAQVVVTNMASGAAPSGDGGGGGINVYQNAYLIWILPHSLLTVSLATAMLPAASRFAAAGDHPGVAAETNRALRLALTFALPASVALAVLADPITRVPFGNGVGANDYHFVAWALAAFAIGLVPYTVQYLELRAFYALDNTKSPFLLQTWISGANALLAVLLVMGYANPPTVAARLALAYSAAYLLGVFITHRALKKRLPDLDGRAAWHHIVRLFWATIPAAALAWVITWWFARYPSPWLRIAGLALAGLVAVLAFFFAAKRLGIPEATTLVGVLRRRKGDEGESDAVEAIVEEVDQEDDQRPGPAPAAAAEPLEVINPDPDGTGVFVRSAPVAAPPEDVLDFPEPPPTELQARADAEEHHGRLLGERYR